MPKKWLSHHGWVAQQFEQKYLKKGHRNAFIHSAIIEGIVVNESGKYKFDSANKSLLRSNKISSSEFCIFNKIREIRNKVTHEIFKDRGLSQKDMDTLLEELIKRVYQAYKMSEFLNKSLFEKYTILRLPIISFNPPQ